MKDTKKKMSATEILRASEMAAAEESGKGFPGLGWKVQREEFDGEPYEVLDQSRITPVSIEPPYKAGGEEYVGSVTLTKGPAKITISLKGQIAYDPDAKYEEYGQWLPGSVAEMLEMLGHRSFDDIEVDVTGSGVEIMYDEGWGEGETDSIESLSEFLYDATDPAALVYGDGKVSQKENNMAKSLNMDEEVIALSNALLSNAGFEVAEEEVVLEDAAENQVDPIEAAADTVEEPKEADVDKEAAQQVTNQDAFGALGELGESFDTLIKGFKALTSKELVGNHLTQAAELVEKTDEQLQSLDTVVRTWEKQGEGYWGADVLAKVSFGDTVADMRGILEEIITSLETPEGVSVADLAKQVKEAQDMLMGLVKRLKPYRDSIEKMRQAALDLRSKVVAQMYSIFL